MNTVKIKILGSILVALAILVSIGYYFVQEKEKEKAEQARIKAEKQKQEDFFYGRNGQGVNLADYFGEAEKSTDVKKSTIDEQKQTTPSPEELYQQNQ